MKRVVWMASSPEPTRSVDAQCARCGHRGTIGFVARGDGVPTVQARYCFRCWPPARREALEAWHREMASANAATIAWLQRGGPASGLPEPPDDSGGISLQAAWWRSALAHLVEWTIKRSAASDERVT